MATFLRILDKLYIVKRILSWLFHSIGLFFLIRQNRYWGGRYSAAYQYTSPSVVYTISPDSYKFA